MAEHEQSSMAGLKKIFIIVLLASFSTGKQDSCKERESCNSKINKYSLKINCGCDKSCVAIGDCCSDYRRHGDMPKPLPTTPDCEPTSLIRSVTIRNGNMIPIVKKCPTDFMNTYIKQRCEMQEKLLPITATKIATNFTLLVPVFGKSSSVLFANVYCAICNGEKETAFLDVDFQNYSPLQFEKLVHMKDLNRFHTVFPRTRVTMSHADYMPRPCLSSKETCAETWPEDEVKSLCQNSATSLVYTRSNVTTYKNRYCAKCNYVDDINLTCNNPKRHLGSGPPPWSMFPYSLLFDLNTGMTVSRRQLRSTNSMEVISMHKRERDCDTNELYDPFHRNCIDLYCPEGRDVCMHQKDVDGKDPQDFKGENGGLSVFKRNMDILWNTFRKLINILGK